MRNGEERNVNFFGTFLETVNKHGPEGIQAEADMAKGWAQVGDSLHSALLEKAEELGGTELREQIDALATEDSFMIPNADALITLEQRFPGSAKETVKLAETKLLGKLAAEAAAAQ